MNPLPLVPGLHVHSGWWLIPWHEASWAQTPGPQTGSHFWLMKSHAWSCLQSESVLHSTLTHATKGLPWRPALHTQRDWWNYKKPINNRNFNPYITYFNNTFCSTTTWSVWVGAWIKAVFIDASLIKRTVRICATLWSVTLCVRITTISLRTRAHWMVCSGGTLSLWCTGVTDNTRVNASFIDTGFTLRTIWILGTLWSGCN